MVERKKWVLRTQDPKVADDLVQHLDITPMMAQVLINRGLDNVQEARGFIDCHLGDLDDPFMVGGMEKAVARIISALGKEKILIHGDYDVDGVTATSLLVLFLRDLGFSVYYYIPNRVNEGYGINIESIKRFRQEGISLIITVDCGISSIQEIKYAKAHDIDVIVTDHHEPPAKLPCADALINPLLSSCSFPYKSLSGVGLAFYLAAGLRKGLRDSGFFDDRPEPSLIDYLDLVAVGTIADIVPLTGLNRILVKAGMEQLNKNPRLGIKSLLSVCGVQVGQVDSSSVAYRIAPKINAAGRLSDASAGVRLLTTDNEDDADRLAGYLDVENVERQRIEERIFNQAVDKLLGSSSIEKRQSIVLYSSDWHPGVIGIVASRLMERFYRPTILLSMEDGKCKGSARGIPSFHLYQGLLECQDLLTEFGGHKYAAGVKLDLKNVDEFSERFDQVVRERVPEDGFTPTLTLDTETDLETLTFDEIDKLHSLAPFGAGNPEPVIFVSEVEVQSPKVVGKDHLSFQAVKNGTAISAIAFRQAHKLESLEPLMDLAAYPEIQTWRGVRQVRLRVKGMRACEQV
ncbi:MAG: single-stranded-DNA-specific exonuclease RecJ [bacterium]